MKMYLIITNSYDKWMYLFQVLVSTAFIRTEDMTDDTWLSYKALWYEIFRDIDKVYEGTGDRYNPRLINTEIEDLVICVGAKYNNNGNNTMRN